MVRMSFLAVSLYPSSLPAPQVSTWSKRMTLSAGCSRYKSWVNPSTKYVCRILSGYFSCASRTRCTPCYSDSILSILYHHLRCNSLLLMARLLPSIQCAHPTNHLFQILIFRSMSTRMDMYPYSLCKFTCAHSLSDMCLYSWE